jgi:hypothetical protein
MTIEIKLRDAKYVVAQDTNCFTVNKVLIVQDEKSANFGKESLKVINYPTKMSKVLETIIYDNMASSDEVLNLEDYVLRIESCVSELKEQVEFNF